MIHDEVIRVLNLDTMFVQCHSRKVFEVGRHDGIGMTSNGSSQDMTVICVRKIQSVNQVFRAFKQSGTARLS